MAGRDDDFDADLADSGDDRPGMDEVQGDDYSALGLDPDDSFDDDDERPPLPHLHFYKHATDGAHAVALDRPSCREMRTARRGSNVGRTHVGGVACILTT